MRKGANVRHGKGPERGFTLVELLVVIAVVAILIGVLLPSIASARQVAQSLIGLSNTRQLTIAQQGYSASADQWLAGPNTSGVIGVLDNGSRILGSTGADMPTQNFDWISPTMGTELGLSPLRAQRMYEIWERFACPRANRLNDKIFGSAGDIADFEDVNDITPYPQVSYLAPASFHLSPVTSNNIPTWVPSRLRNLQNLVRKGFRNPFTVPEGYKPKMNLIDRPDSKVCVADGTRYVAQEGFGGVILDFDVAPNSGTYGGFTTSGPIFNESVAYGRDALPESEGGINVDLSMRYFDREMHVSFFDGHAERIKALDAWANAEYWYPSGSKATHISVTNEAKSKYEKDEKVP